MSGRPFAASSPWSDGALCSQKIVLEYGGLNADESHGTVLFGTTAKADIGYR